ncbi:MAG: amidohydrolase family protein [Acidobacteriaceae bacterium]
MKTVGLEEHFVLAEVEKAWEAVDPAWADLGLRASMLPGVQERLLEIGPQRIAAMDEAGLDVHVLSLTTPGVQNLDAELAVELARASNDRVALAVKEYPERFQGFATLPTGKPEAAAKELERVVQKLGLQGAMVFGRTRDRNFDAKEFWPVFEAAAALRAPLYMHPQTPQKGVLDANYSGFEGPVGALFGRPGIGWHYEAGVQILRMILAGVFDRFPELKIVTGHMGEVVLFYLDRIDLMSGPAKLPRKISEYVREHVYVTPSGLFSQRYLRWAIEVIGVEHVMMSTDYPFAPAKDGKVRKFLEEAELTEEERGLIGAGNWERMCAGIRR